MTWQNTVGDSLNLLVPAELKAIELILPYLLVTKVWSYLWGPAWQNVVEPSLPLLLLAKA